MSLYVFKDFDGLKKPSKKNMVTFFKANVLSVRLRYSNRKSAENSRKYIIVMFFFAFTNIQNHIFLMSRILCFFCCRSVLAVWSRCNRVRSMWNHPRPLWLAGGPQVSRRCLRSPPASHRGRGVIPHRSDTIPAAPYRQNGSSTKKTQDFLILRSLKKYDSIYAIIKLSTPRITEATQCQTDLSFGSTAHLLLYSRFSLICNIHLYDDAIERKYLTQEIFSFQNVAHAVLQHYSSPGVSYRFLAPHRSIWGKFFYRIKKY